MKNKHILIGGAFLAMAALFTATPASADTAINLDADVNVGVGASSSVESKSETKSETKSDSKWSLFGNKDDKDHDDRYGTSSMSATTSVDASAEVGFFAKIGRFFAKIFGNA